MERQEWATQRGQGLGKLGRGSHIGGQDGNAKVAGRSCACGVTHAWGWEGAEGRMEGERGGGRVGVPLPFVGPVPMRVPVRSSLGAVRRLVASQGLQVLEPCSALGASEHGHAQNEKEASTRGPHLVYSAASRCPVCSPPKAGKYARRGMMGTRKGTLCQESETSSGLRLSQAGRQRGREFGREKAPMEEFTRESKGGWPLS